MKIQITDVERGQIYNDVIVEKMTKTEAAEKYGVSRSTIRRVIKAYETNLAQEARQTGKIPEATKQAIYAAINDKDNPLSRAKAAEKFGVSKSTVGRVLKAMADGVKAVVEAAKKDAEPLKHIITPSSVVVVVAGKPKTISVDHPLYQTIVGHLKAKEWEKAADYVDQASALQKYSFGRVRIEGGKLWFDGELLSTGLAQKMIDSFAAGESIDKYALFMDNLYENPSNHSVDQLWGFMEHEDIKVTDDGYFLAYKRVGPNYLDIHSRTMDNSPGKVVKMRRNKVEDNPDITCSHGLHVCAKSYLSQYGGGGGNKTVLCKVNPRDVVSVPKDYKNAKMRVCEYTVAEDISDQF